MNSLHSPRGRKIVHAKKSNNTVKPNRYLIAKPPTKSLSPYFITTTSTLYESAQTYSDLQGAMRYDKVQS